MTFLSPERLWLLALVPVLAGLYVAVQWRRRRHTVRFTNLALLQQVAPRRPGWRRHVAAGLFLVMILLMMAGFARPADDVRVPRDRATIMVAIDVSLSMMARDVPPDRFGAAKSAAKQFIRDLPPRFNVGVIGFAGNASLVAAPGDDRAAAIASIDRLSLAKRTGIGEAVFTSLQAVRSFDEQARQDPPPAHIVLLSDGDNTTGRSVQEAVVAGRNADVPVSTIAFGTPYGTVTIEGQTTSVSVNKETLRFLADNTGGRPYEAADAGQLGDVYSDIGTSLGYTTEHRDVSARYIGIALLFALAAGGASLAWFNRLP